MFHRVAKSWTPLKWLKTYPQLSPKIPLSAKILLSENKSQRFLVVWLILKAHMTILIYLHQHIICFIKCRLAKRFMWVILYYTKHFFIIICSFIIVSWKRNVRKFSKRISSSKNSAERNVSRKGMTFRI